MQRPLALVLLVLAIAALIVAALLQGSDEPTPVAVGDGATTLDEHGDAGLVSNARQGNGEIEVARDAASSGGSSRTAGSTTFATWPEDGIDLIVVDATTRRPVPGAVVTFIDPREHTPGDVARMERVRRHSWRELFDEIGSQVQCDDLGRARVPRRVWELTAQHGSRQGTRSLWGGFDEPVEVAIAEPESVAVRVRTEAGAPVAGIGVVYRDWGRRVVLDRRVTDEHGVARFERVRLEGHAERFGTSPQGFVPQGLFRESHDVLIADPDRDFPTEIELVVPAHGSVVVEVPQDAPIGPSEIVGIAHFTHTKALARESDPRRVEALVRPLRRGDVRFDFVGIGRDLRVLLDETGEGRVDLTFDGPGAQDEVVRVPLTDLRPEPRLVGRVIDGRGEPVSSRRLTLAPFGETVGRSLKEFSVATDGLGRFETALPTSAWFGGAFLVRDPVEFGRSRAIPFEELAERDVVDLGDIVLERDVAIVRGRVLGVPESGVDGGVEGARVGLSFVHTGTSPPDGEAYRTHQILAGGLLEDFGTRLAADETVAPDRTITTRADGRFTVCAPPGARLAIVEVSHRSYTFVREVIELSEFEGGSATEVVLRPDPRYVLRGIVVGIEPAELRSNGMWIAAAKRGGVRAGTMLSDEWIEVSAVGSGRARVEARPPFDPAEIDGDTFELTRSTSDPIELLLVVGTGPYEVLANLGTYTPLLEPAQRHPLLDPLNLGGLTDSLRLEIVAPDAEREFGARLSVVGDSGRTWFEGWDTLHERSTSNGDSWEVVITGAVGWREPLTVALAGFRPVRLEHHGLRERVELEPGPRLELAIEYEGDSGSHRRNVVVLEGDRPVSSERGSDGRRVFRLMEPGRVQVVVTVLGPNTFDGTGFPSPEHVNDSGYVDIVTGSDIARVWDGSPLESATLVAWSALEYTPITVAEFNVPEAGLITNVVIPDHEGLTELAARQATERGRRE